MPKSRTCEQNVQNNKKRMKEEKKNQLPQRGHDSEPIYDVKRINK